MNHTLQLFLKRPTTWIGIATALMFQLIFSVVWMTGYNGVNDRIHNLKVGIVNEDPEFGAKIAQQLQETLPVRTETFGTEAEAQRKLNDRELQMVIHIPATFTADASAADKTATIAYTLNESNSALIKSMMTSVSAQVTASVNKVAAGQSIQQALAQANLPADQAAAAAAALSERVSGKVTSVNPIDGMNNQMVPMMLVLASFVGAMIMGMNLEQSSMAAAAAGAGRWRRFGARALINVAAAVFVSLVGSTMVLALGGQSVHGFAALWGMLFLILLTFMFVTQMFLLLFGLGGMLFNILLLSAQLVSSGAMVPRELLSGFYLNLGKALPATYAVEGGMNVLFGGPGVGHAAGALLAIAAVAVAVGALAVTLKPQRRPQAAAVPTPAAG
ncbi:YhgE/Pip domain-containing protein [Cohnella sp. REN36]|uniref:YhgE/Pip domain-containing protein n=1 Tax=Cohnella sp. REN36 TaxID=2887347 RepID=UPI001D15376B|nr:ABC transporter permease [Cohnella sp. REN36]MCC3377127.1 SNG1 family protein [Cohnella sp. REN36]